MAQVHGRALELAGQLGIEPEPPLVWSLALAALTRGDWETGGEYGERLRTRAEHDGDDVLWVESAYIRGISAYWPGRLAQARDNFNTAMERFRPARRRAHVLRYGQDPELVVRLRLAHTLWLLGDEEGADRQRDVALVAAEESTHTYSRGVAAVWAGILALDRGQVAELRRHVELLGTIAGSDAPGQIDQAAELLAGHLDVLEGRVDVGLARVRRVQEQLVRGPFAPGQPGVATRTLLEDYAIAGEARAGLALADAAVAMGRGAELWEAEIRRLRAGFVVSLDGCPEDVEAELQCALAVARRQGARAFEERIQGTLAERRLSHPRGHR
jgi:hypothetical protein